jgi:hypothetical protein
VLNGQVSRRYDTPLRERLREGPLPRETAIAQSHAIESVIEAAAIARRGRTGESVRSPGDAYFGGREDGLVGDSVVIEVGHANDPGGDGGLNGDRIAEASAQRGRSARVRPRQLSQ